MEENVGNNAVKDSDACINTDAQYTRPVSWSCEYLGNETDGHSTSKTKTELNHTGSCEELSKISKISGKCSEKGSKFGTPESDVVPTDSSTTSEQSLTLASHGIAEQVMDSNNFEFKESSLNLVGNENTRMIAAKASSDVDMDKDVSTDGDKAITTTEPGVEEGFGKNYNKLFRNPSNSIEETSVAITTSMEENKTIMNSPGTAEYNGILNSLGTIEDIAIVNSPDTIEDIAIVDSPGTIEDIAIVNSPGTIEDIAIVDSPGTIEDIAIVNSPSTIEDNAIVKSPDTTEDIAIVDSPGTIEDIAIVNSPGTIEDIAIVNSPGTNEDLAIVNSPGTIEDIAIVNSPGTIEDIAIVNSPGTIEDIAIVNSPGTIEDIAIVNSSGTTEDVAIMDSLGTIEDISIMNWTTATIQNIALMNTTNSDEEEGTVGNSYGYATFVNTTTTGEVPHVTAGVTNSTTVEDSVSNTVEPGITVPSENTTNSEKITLNVDEITVSDISQQFNRRSVDNETFGENSVDNEDGIACNSAINELGEIPRRKDDIKMSSAEVSRSELFSKNGSEETENVRAGIEIVEFMIRSDPDDSCVEESEGEGANYINETTSCQTKDNLERSNQPNENDKIIQQLALLNCLPDEISKARLSHLSDISEENDVEMTALLGENGEYQVLESCVAKDAKRDKFTDNYNSTRDSLEPEAGDHGLTNSTNMDDRTQKPGLTGKKESDENISSEYVCTEAVIETNIKGKFQRDSDDVIAKDYVDNTEDKICEGESLLVPAAEQGTLDHISEDEHVSGFENLTDPTEQDQETEYSTEIKKVTNLFIRSRYRQISKKRLVYITVIKYVLFFFNFICWVAGVSAAATGYWMIADKHKVVRDALDFFLDPAIILCVSGGIIFIVAFFGFVGALRENILLLKIWHISLSVFLVAELIFGILVFLFYFFPGIRRDLNLAPEDWGLKEAIRKYKDDKGMRDWIDMVQREMKCCGVTNSDEGYRDWQENKYYHCSESNPSPLKCSVPPSCCIIEPGDYYNTMCGYNTNNKEVWQVETEIFTQGCVQGFGKWLQRNAVIIGAIFAGIVIPQFIGIVMARVYIKLTTSKQVQSRWKTWKEKSLAKQADSQPQPTEV